MENRKDDSKTLQIWMRDVEQNAYKASSRSYCTTVRRSQPVNNNEEELVM